jgi:hypothetical protein
MITFFTEHILSLSFLASIIASFVTSFIFLFALLFLFRPRVKISSKIATHVKGYWNLNEEKWFCIKMVNCSLFRAFDLRVELCQKIPVTGPEGKQNHRTVNLKLMKDQYHYVPKYAILGSRTDYAVWFMTVEDIEELLNKNEHCTIELRVICKHELTGLGRVFVRNFSKHDILQGTFKSGNTFEIVH